jgi:hypothetical protein
LIPTMTTAFLGFWLATRRGKRLFFAIIFTTKFCWELCHTTLHYTVVYSTFPLKAKSGVFRLVQSAWKIFLWSRGTSKRILVSVVCSIIKLFKFTFNKNLNFAPQDTWSWWISRLKTLEVG